MTLHVRGRAYREARCEQFSWGNIVRETERYKTIIAMMKNDTRAPWNPGV